MDVTLAPAGADDEAVLLEMMRGLYVHDEIPWDEARARRALHELLASPAFGRVWLIRRGADVAGYLVLTLGFSLEFGGRDAFVDELFIREEHRGGGVGRRALELALEHCRELGAHALHLEVEHGNTAAQGFYRRLGFVDHDRYLLTRWVS